MPRTQRKAKQRSSRDLRRIVPRAAARPPGNGQQQQPPRPPPPPPRRVRGQRASARPPTNPAPPGPAGGGEGRGRRHRHGCSTPGRRRPPASSETRAAPGGRRTDPGGGGGMLAAPLLLLLRPLRRAVVRWSSLRLGKGRLRAAILSLKVFSVASLCFLKGWLYHRPFGPDTAFLCSVCSRHYQTSAGAFARTAAETLWTASHNRVQQGLGAKSAVLERKDTAVQRNCTDAHLPLQRAMSGLELPRQKSPGVLSCLPQSHRRGGMYEKSEEEIKAE